MRERISCKGRKKPNNQKTKNEEDKMDKRERKQTSIAYIICIKMGMLMGIKSISDFFSKESCP